MRRFTYSIALVTAGAIALGIAGCARNEDSAERAAKEALGVQKSNENETNTVEKHNVLVEKTTTVREQESGKVLSTKKEVTPVTVTREKETETDIDVDAGRTQKAISSPKTD